MARHKSAIKRHRQNLKRRDRNISKDSAVKTIIKQVREKIAENNVENAKIVLANATKVIDKAVSNGTLHRNNASRKISRLTMAVNKL